MISATWNDTYNKSETICYTMKVIYLHNHIILSTLSINFYRFVFELHMKRSHQWRYLSYYKLTMFCMYFQRDIFIAFSILLNDHSSSAFGCEPSKNLWCKAMTPLHFWINIQSNEACMAYTLHSSASFNFHLILPVFPYCQL